MEGVKTVLETFISTLTTGLSADALWGAIAPIAPLMVIVVLVGLGRRILQKNLNSAQKGTSAKTK